MAIKSNERHFSLPIYQKKKNIFISIFFYFVYVGTQLLAGDNLITIAFVNFKRVCVQAAVAALTPQNMLIYIYMNMASSMRRQQRIIPKGWGFGCSFNCCEIFLVALPPPVTAVIKFIVAKCIFVTFAMYLAASVLEQFISN